MFLYTFSLFKLEYSANTQLLLKYSALLIYFDKPPLTLAVERAKATSIHNIVMKPAFKTEPVAVRRLHCSGTRNEPKRYRSCYAFLAGTESVPVEGAVSITEQCRR